MIKVKIYLSIIVTFSIFQLNAINYSGAGILPYARNPQDKKLYFLFSQEAFGQNKGKWAEAIYF